MTQIMGSVVTVGQRRRKQSFSVVICYTAIDRKDGMKRELGSTGHPEALLMVCRRDISTPVSSKSGTRKPGKIHELSYHILTEPH